MTENKTAFKSELYPMSWDEFQGQDAAKRQLRVGAVSAKARGQVMDHVLLSSPIPGIGKTALALLTSMELGTGIRIQVGPVKNNQLPYLFEDMRDGDVLFFDEIHRQAQSWGKGEWLLNYMQDGVLESPLGVDDTVPRVTIIGATTDAGRLASPILARFVNRPTLTPYSDEEATRIALQMSRKVLEPASLALPTPEKAAAIAVAGNNNPRQMGHILCSLRDLVWAGEVEESGGDYDLTDAFSFAGVSPDGLSSQAQQYLTILLQEFRGNPAGQKPLADRLGEVGNGMRDLERVLLDKGLIGLTPRGRMLTPAGRRRAKDLVAAAA